MGSIGCPHCPCHHSSEQGLVQLCVAGGDVAQCQRSIQSGSHAHAHASVRGRRFSNAVSWFSRRASRKRCSTYSLGVCTMCTTVALCGSNHCHHPRMLRHPSRLNSCSARVRARVCAFVWVFVCENLCMCTCVHACVRACVCVCVCSVFSPGTRMCVRPLAIAGALLRFHCIHVQ